VNGGGGGGNFFFFLAGLHAGTRSTRVGAGRLAGLTYFVDTK